MKRLQLQKRRMDGSANVELLRLGVLHAVELFSSVQDSGGVLLQAGYCFLAPDYEVGR